MIELGIEKASRSFSRFDSSRKQKTRHQGSYPRFPRDSIGELFVSRLDEPAQKESL
jgi:hypothetical protein